MNPVSVLPDTVIEPNGMVAQAFLSRNLKPFRQACQWIKDLPYGSNSSTEDSLILFEENCGTGTTKHGIIARLAQELDLAIYKNLGLFDRNSSMNCSKATTIPKTCWGMEEFSSSSRRLWWNAV